MQRTERFILESDPKEVIEEVEKRIKGKGYDVEAVKLWVREFLKKPDKRQVFWKNLIRLLEG